MNLLRRARTFSVHGLLESLRARRMVRRYAHHAHPTTFAWDWRSTHFNRMALVNHLVSVTGGVHCRYLEIGCAGNDLFDSVAALDKTGVDPASGGTHRMTSDAFFASHDQTFDVIFIDGLHTYEQVRRDTLQALGRSRPGGWIAIHDLLPRTWQEQHVPSVQEPWKEWTGDGWKVAVELSRAQGLEFHVIRIDHGIGLLRTLDADASIPDMTDTLADAQFDVFVEHVDTLPIVDVHEALQIIDRNRRPTMPDITRSEPYADLMHLAVVHGDTVHLAGIVADDLSADMEGQTRDVLKQLDEFAAAHGLDRTRVLSATIYVTNLADKPAMNRVWQEFFDPAHLPARATIGVADLGPGVRLEMVAVLGR